MIGLIQGYYHQMRFRVYSMPISVKLASMGFGLMFAAVLVSINMYDLRTVPTNPDDMNGLAYLGLVALIGLILFGIGIMYGVKDLYSHFKRDVTK